MLKRLLFAVLMVCAMAAHAGVKSLPWGPKPQFVDANGAPMSSGTLTFYAAGSTTPQNTYTDSAGTVANANPITLNSRGETPNEVWLTEGQSYKLLLKDAGGSTIWTVDNITGVNDTATLTDEWKASLLTPTFVSATSFTLAGDQTTTFHVGRRVKTTNSGGTVYSTITASSFGASTSVTVENDSGSLDAGLSAVSYSLISQANGSDPAFTDQRPVVVNVTDRTKRVRISASGLTAGKTRVVTMSDSDVTLGLPRSYLSGLALANNAGDATNDIDIAVGACRDSGNAVDIVLASALTKQLDAAWAVGTNAGMRASGAAIANTTYHIFVIRRPDTGVVDVAADTSATGANIAANTNANYTQIRRIGSIVRAGGTILAFKQDGDLFQWLAVVADVSATNPGTAAVTRTLTVPTGINVVAKTLIGLVSDASGGLFAYLSDLSVNDAAAAAGVAQAMVNTGPANAAGAADVRTNTSSQIRSRISASFAGSILVIGTAGWVDRRGRDD